MKRFLVVSLVLAAAGTGSAALSLVYLGGGQVGINLDPAANTVYYFAASLNLTLTGYELTEKAGGLGNVDDYGSFNWASSPYNLSAVGTAKTYEITSSGATGQPVTAGVQFIATFDLPEGHSFADEPVEGAHAVARVDLIRTDPAISILGTLYVVPEPITLGLLGFGALLLGRRRI